MKKRISVLIVVLAAFFGLAGCTSNSETLEYDEETIQQATEFLIEYCNSVDEDTIEEWNSRTDFAVEQELYSAGLPFTPESFLGAMDSWQSGIDECGAYAEHGEFNFEATADELTVTVPARFEERSATLEFIYDENLYLDSMTVSGIYSTGEILEKAGLNTVLGMGTVFCVLIFISIIIWLLKFIPAIEQFFRGTQSQRSPGPGREGRGCAGSSGNYRPCRRSGTGSSDLRGHRGGGRDIHRWICGAQHPQAPVK